MFYARTFTLVALLILGFLLYEILLPFFSPIAWALFIAFLILPIHEWLAAKLGGRRKLSAALLTPPTIAILVGPIAGLGAGFGAQAGELLRYVQQLATDHGSTRMVDFETMPVIGSAVTLLPDKMGGSLEEHPRGGT